jgi:hypothetical protein
MLMVVKVLDTDLDMLLIRCVDGAGNSLVIANSLPCPDSAGMLTGSCLSLGSPCRSTVVALAAVTMLI